MAGKTKTMIVSVGGTSAPIVFSLNKSKPDFICFFVSRDSKKFIETIVANLEVRPKHYDWIMTPNPELLSDSYSALDEKLPGILEKWEVKLRDVCVDYTGGTKTMSVALVLATIEKSCCFSYVGGDERSKDGVGVVVDGKEKMWFLDNPWDAVAVKERREVSLLFNKARYASAADILEGCIQMVGKEHKPLFKALKQMVLGYDAWDRFRHSNAKAHLFRSSEVLTELSTAARGMKPVVNQLDNEKK